MAAQWARSNSRKDAADGRAHGHSRNQSRAPADGWRSCGAAHAASHPCGFGRLGLFWTRRHGEQLACARDVGGTAFRAISTILSSSDRGRQRSLFFKLMKSRRNFQRRIRFRSFHTAWALRASYCDAVICPVLKAKRKSRRSCECVAFDPYRRFALAICRIAKGLFNHLVGLSKQGRRHGNALPQISKARQTAIGSAFVLRPRYVAVLSIFAWPKSARTVSKSPVPFKMWRAFVRLRDSTP